MQNAVYGSRKEPQTIYKTFTWISDKTIFCCVDRAWKLFREYIFESGERRDDGR